MRYWMLAAGAAAAGTVLGFAAGLTVFAGLFFGIAPALRASRVDLNETLKLAGRSASTNLGRKLRWGLAAAEVALTTVLLIGAGRVVTAGRGRADRRTRAQGYRPASDRFHAGGNPAIGYDPPTPATDRGREEPP